MHITHPQGMMGNLRPEDVFIAVDDMGMELGRGYIVMQFQPHIYPDCPINLYISLESQPSARFMLFGALVARARQLRDSNQQYAARVYTAVQPGDVPMQQFYMECGFKIENMEDVLSLTIPAGDGRIPMSCAVVQTPLNTLEERGMFCARMQQNDLSFLNVDYLTNLMRQPHFLALGLYQNNSLIGEIVMAGAGESCDLVGVYIVPELRRQGMGRALVHRAMAVMATEGVTRVIGRAMRYSQPQVHLMNDFAAQPLGVTTIYPCLSL